MQRLESTFIYTDSEKAGSTKEQWRDAKLRTFCTMKLMTSRRCGHSSALFKLIREYDLKGLILFPVLKQTMIGDDFEYNRDNVTLSSVGSLRMNPTKFYDDEKWDFIALEQATYVRSKDIKNIYNLALRKLVNDPAFIIMIQ
jgi:hypothetical protein